jgi:type IV pilus biogenesis protein CpaD/CtpE
MKNKVLNYIVCGIITLTLAGCGNKSESKTDSEIKTKTELNNEFVYVESDKKIELIFENNAKHLVIGKPTKTKFVTENINNQKLMIYGSGIMVNSANNDGFRFIITPIEKTLVNGNLEIQITERVENGDNFTHKFLVPVKTTE